MSARKSETVSWNWVWAMFALLLAPMAAHADSTHIATGPVTNWSYGWKNSPTGNFTLFPSRSTAYGLPSWHNGGQGYTPILVNNTNKKVTVPGTDFVIPRNQISLHPSNEGQLAVVRWVADSNGIYQIQGLFQGLESCGYLKQTLSGKAMSTFSLQQSLVAGNTVDFQVDDGGNQYYCDSVGLSALLTDL